MAPNIIDFPSNPALFWQWRSDENKVLCEKILAKEHCELYELLIVLAHFYQALDSYLRSYPLKGVIAENEAPILKTIRLWYIHPENEKFSEVKATCDVVLDEIRDLEKNLKGQRLSLPPTFFENTKKIVVLFQEQF